MRDEQVTLHISRDEALVLLDLLYRWLEQNKGQKIRSHLQDDAELWAMNALYCSLETVVVEAFNPEYTVVLKAAHERLREQNGGSWPWL